MLYYYINKELWKQWFKDNMPTPEEVLADFTRMQAEKNKTSVTTVPSSVAEQMEKPFLVSTDNTELDLVEHDSRGPENPLEIPQNLETLPHVSSTGPISPVVNKLNVFDSRARVPNNFMSSVAVILKDAGADSMSQEKALAKIQNLLEYPKAEPDMSERKTGTPVEQIPAQVGSSTNRVVKSEVPGHPDPA